jgi:hypothetical protein
LRRLIIFLLVLLVAGSAATGVHASTDCERWIAAYKNSLAQAETMKRIRIANHRLHSYVKRKVAAYTKPRPTIPVVHHPRPKPRMTPAEMIRKFELACGELPEGSAETPTKMAQELPPGFVSERPWHDNTFLDEAANPPLTLASLEPPAYDNPASWPPSDDGPPFFGPGFGPIYGGGGGGGTKPGTPNTPNNPLPPGGNDTPPPTDPIPPVTATAPEPSSFVFLLTGLAGATGMVRRRLGRRG